MDVGWSAVAEAINTRLVELKMTQHELAQRSGVSVATLRQLQRNYQPKRRNPRTLAAISEGLRWPPHHLTRVLEGAGSPEPPAEVEPDVIAAIHTELRDLQTRVAALEAAQSGQ